MASDTNEEIELGFAGLRIGRPPLSEEDATLRTFLRQNSREFETVHELREQGWNNPKGDEHYERKHKIADRHIRDADQEKVYYQMYLVIARELQEATAVFTVNGSTPGKLRGFNLCMAPGGYTRVLLDHNPQMTISGITLPEAQTGHPVVTEVAADPRVGVEYLDINLLATSMGVPASDIPADHPDAEKFLTHVPFADLEFDVVIADGAVLRTHDRGEHRLDKEREALRLRLSQLILGFGRIKDGGTFMVLLHRIDSWENFVLLRKLEQFSEVKVHKPTVKHAESSSFYIVAKNVDRDRLTATAVLDEWKAYWRQVTFGGEEGKGELPQGPGNDVVEKAFQEYGARYMELGRPVWETQARALEKAPYMKLPDARTSNARQTSSNKTATSSNKMGTVREKTPENPKLASILKASSWRTVSSPSIERAGDDADQTSQADSGSSKRETSAKPTRPPAASLPSWR